MTVRFRDGAASVPSPRTVLLLVNLGTPAAPTAAAVRRFLAQFLHDRRVVELTRWLWCPLLHFLILPLRAPRLAKKYAAIWPTAARRCWRTAAPSPRRCRHSCRNSMYAWRCATASRRFLRRCAPPMPRRHARAGAAAVSAVLRLDHRHRARAVAAELAGWRRRPALSLLSDYHLDEDWLRRWPSSVREHWQAQGRGERLLLSFHGLPAAQDRAGDPYARQCRASADALAQLLGLARGRMAAHVPVALRPRRMAAALHRPDAGALARERVRRVDVLCPGFAVDCLETLEEIAVENAERFRAAGGEALRYIPALNAGVAHARALAAIARRELLAGAER
jgi:ferrochelatase